MKRSSVGFHIVLAVICAIVAISVVLAFEAVYEDVRLARMESEIITLVSAARDTAAHDAGFDSTPGQDLLFTLWRRGLVLENQPTSALVNPWGGAIQMTSAEPMEAWIETDVPVRICRQLALFFGRDAGDLLLRKMQVRGMQGNGTWRTAYDADASRLFNPAAAETACGAESRVALTFLLRLKN